MGKKPRKTKELSVAIAEASWKGEEQQPQSLLQTPRKRGRPRKVVEMKEQLGEEEEEQQQQQAEDIKHGVADEDSKNKFQKIKTKEPEEQQSSERGERTQIPTAKEEGSSVGGERKQPSTSRARRKSKPRKSS